MLRAVVALVFAARRDDPVATQHALEPPVFQFEPAELVVEAPTEVPYGFDARLNFVVRLLVAEIRDSCNQAAGNVQFGVLALGIKPLVEVAQAWADVHREGVTVIDTAVLGD